VPRQGPTAQAQHGMERIILQYKHLIFHSSIHKLLECNEDDIKIEEMLPTPVIPQEVFHQHRE
jgi:hypothetical protein